VRSVLPGLAAAGLIALAASASRPLLPDGLSDIAVAILLGLLVANLLPVRAILGPGARLAVQRILRIGIALLGARLAVDEVVRGGAGALLLVTATTAAVLLVGGIIAIRSPRPMSHLLIAAGTAVCGNSAIVALAPVLDADEADVSVAVATITGFGIAAVLVYPLVGSMLDLPSAAFGLWAGAAVNDTSQVVAAGYAYDAVAGDTAVVTKLTRNLLIAPVLVGAGLLVARRAVHDARDGGRPAAPVLDVLRRSLPVFVAGFLLFATLRSLGLLDVAVAGRPAHALLGSLASALVLVALAGVGLQTDVRAVLAAGLRPVAFGFALGLALAVGSLAAIVGLGLGRA
jgi:uncharacterized integral membrane protein (TIGR00698 family)